MNKAFSAVIIATCLCASAAAADAQLPVLNWLPAHDWVNVKTDVSPAAVGDGITDDTAALQAGFNTMHGYADAPKVVYIPPGTYRITDTIVMPSSVGSMVIGHGQDTRIVWDGLTDHEPVIDQATLEALRANPKFPNQPDEDNLLSPSVLEVLDRGDYYGERLQTYIKAPETGNYTFWVTGDDHCEVWLSTDSAPENATLLCSVPGWTNERVWDKYPQQQSAVRTLTAGQSYYMEILHKEAAGGAHVAVGWQLPDGTLERPIPISRCYVSPNIHAQQGFRYQYWKDATPKMSRMMWSNGATNATYIGIVWDGNGKARIGVHHNARDRFECKVTHEHEAFLDFTEAGVKMGPQNPYATSETEFRNCIFTRCNQGIALVDFNYYNELADGCLFTDCGYGVYANQWGQIYVRNCRFERSTIADLRLSDSHKHSVRRCVSTGSKMFITNGSSVTVQDCNISSWTNTTGAIVVSSTRTPVVIFDCVFSNPPNTAAPIRSSVSGLDLVVSNNTNQGQPAGVSGSSLKLLEVPPGELSGALVPSELNVPFRQLKVPTRVFDAVRDFHADTAPDVAAAVQATIDAARRHGNGAIAYFPPRRYRISRTIQVTGGNYIIGGTGYHSEFQWTGATGGTLFSIVDPQDITIRSIQVIGHSVPTDMLGIRQTSTGVRSSITYDNVMVPTGFRTTAENSVRGIEFSGLGENCRVLVRRINGSAAVVNSAASDVIFRYLDGSLLVENPGNSPRTGFTGMLNGNTQVLAVRDNLDFVVFDYYVEQSSSTFLRLAGNPTDPPGRVTIGAARLHQWSSAPYFAEIDNYRGQFTYAHAHVTFDNSPPTYLVNQTGTTPADLLLFGHSDYGFTLNLNGSSRAILAANKGATNSIPSGGMATLTAALDHFRLLGIKDIETTSSTWTSPALPGDTNGDCTVDMFDLIFVRNHLGESIDGNNSQADVNGDSSINMLDLVFVRNRLGNNCGE